LLHLVYVLPITSLNALVGPRLLLHDHVQKPWIANSPGLTRSLQVLMSGVRFPGLALKSPGCEANWSKNLLFQIESEIKHTLFIII